MLWRAGWFLINAIQAIYVGLWSIFWISLAGIVSLFSRSAPLAMARHFWGPGLIRGAGVDLRIEGAELLDPKVSYVFVMNHQSMIDIPIAFAALPNNLVFVLKRVLAWVPFLGFYCWRMGMIFVDRKNASQAYASLSRGVARLRPGTSLLAYPEGTRATDGKVRPFKKGPFFAAQMARLPVVPVAIEGSWRVLPRSTFAVRPGVVRMRIGRPIPTADLGAEDVLSLMRRARAELIAMHRAIGGVGGDPEPMDSALGGDGAAPGLRGRRGPRGSGRRRDTREAR